MNENLKDMIWTLIKGNFNRKINNPSNLFINGKVKKKIFVTQRKDHKLIALKRILSK